MELYSPALEYIPIHALGTIGVYVAGRCNSLTLSLRILTTRLERDRQGLGRKDLSHLTPAIPPQTRLPGFFLFGRLRSDLLML